MDSNRSALITGGVIGLIAGILIFLWPLWSWRLGMTEFLFLAIAMLVLTFWIALIVVIVRALSWMGRDRSYRLEDLPAYFEEWHQRAHAHMRETASADHPDRRG